MADEDAPGETAFDRHFGDNSKRAGGRLAGFVDVEIELPPLTLGEREQNRERLAQARRHGRHRAENLRSIGVERRLDAAHVNGVERELGHEQRNALHLDPASPSLARLGEDRPADCGLLTDAVDMRADGRGAVSIGRA